MWEGTDSKDDSFGTPVFMNSSVRVEIGGSEYSLGHVKISNQWVQSLRSRNVWLKNGDSNILSFNIWFKNNLPTYVVMNTKEGWRSTCNNKDCTSHSIGYKEYDEGNFVVFGTLCEGAGHTRLKTPIRFKIQVVNAGVDYIQLTLGGD